MERSTLSVHISEAEHFGYMQEEVAQAVLSFIPPF